MRIALYQPDIPQNTGNIFRLAACLGVSVDVIEPTGFFLMINAFKDRRWIIWIILTTKDILIGKPFINGVKLIIID